MTEKTETPRTDAIVLAGISPEDSGFNPHFVLSANLAEHARELERLWRTAEAAREKLEQELLAIQSDARTPKADERLARLQRRADYIRNRAPSSEGGMHRDKAERSALDWIIARETHRERELQSARKDERERCAKVCEKRAEERWAEYGVTESDTNASYYPRSEEWCETADEEAESCAAAIRALGEEDRG